VEKWHLLVGGIVALAVVSRLLRGIVRARTNSKPWPFYARKLMSQPEQTLYHRLVRALPDHIVLAQVQVSRVLGVRKGSRFHEWNNRINRLSYDFVVCSRDSSVFAAIELDDKSHQAESRVLTDAKKDKATQDAGIRMIRWSVSAMPSEAAIRDELLSALHLGLLSVGVEPRLVLPNISLERTREG
jgi:hypothetical protein